MGGIGAVDVLQARRRLGPSGSPSGLYWEERRLKNNYRDCQELREMQCSAWIFFLANILA